VLERRTRELCGCETAAPCTLTFADLTPADREALGSYATGETLTLWRTWSAAEGVKLTGRGLAYPPFEEVRKQQNATDLRRVYKELRDARPELELPPDRSQAQVREAMDAWETENPEALEPAEYSATHLFGVVGQPKLNGRFDYVFVPAVTDVQHEVRGAALSLRGCLNDRRQTRPRSPRGLRKSSAKQGRGSKRSSVTDTATLSNCSAIVWRPHSSSSCAMQR
jgi:hypothetical protein